MQLKRLPKLITFDLDGTLVDSVADLHQSVNIMQAELGNAPCTEEAVRSWVGNGIERLVHRALTGTLEEDADSALFPEALWRFRRAYQNHNGTHSTIYPGTVETLQHCIAAGIKVACVTNKAAQFTLPLLQNLDIDKYFEITVPGDMLPHKKPHPAQLLHCAAEYDTAIEDCLHVGDSISDIRAARAAGFACVCVSYGYNHGISIRSLAPDEAADHVIDEMSELTALVLPSSSDDDMTRAG